jgi:hypothetical protein
VRAEDGQGGDSGRQQQVAYGQLNTNQSALFFPSSSFFLFSTCVDPSPFSHNLSKITPGGRHVPFLSSFTAYMHAAAFDSLN